MAVPTKRSLTIAGHRTSVSLENEFWEALNDVATEMDITLPALVSRIDAQREKTGLSSAIRVYLLDYYRRG